MTVRIPTRIYLYAEFIGLFVVLPLLLVVLGSRTGIYLTILGGAAYGLWVLRRQDNFSYRRLWDGKGWPPERKRFALTRFAVLAGLLMGLTVMLVPDKLFAFPTEHFLFWLLIMALYPVISVIPQEFMFRSFFFSRYENIIGAKLSILFNGLLFGYSHIVMNNAVAPFIAAIGGVILAHSFTQHRSLKWAVVEHALYGCWIFTVGIGWYFFSGNWVNNP